MELISAGLGDTLGKYTALTDWKLAHLINGEYYCEEIVRMVEEALQSVRELSGGLSRRDPDAVEALTRTLILTGLAMSFAGNSRPASGSEHHLSHFWEMRFQMEGRKPIPHGIKVGVGLITVLKLYASLAEETPDFAAAKKAVPDKKAWEEDVRREYRDAAEGILRLEETVGKNSIEGRNRRLDAMEANWQEICRIIREDLPSAEEAEKLGAPVNPEQIGLSAELVEAGVRLAKEVRDRFTVLQILWDLGLADRCAKAAAGYFTEGQPLFREQQKEQIREKISRVRCFVLDMDGTIYLGNELFPFTKAFLQRAKETGRRCVFFTNNSSKGKQDYLDKLARMGIDVEPGNMYSSSEVIAEFLRAEHPDAACYLVGTPALEAVLRDSGVKLVQEKADIVVVGFDTTLTYDKLDKASRFLEQGALFYAVHEDRVCPVEGGHMMPDCGSIAALLRTATGKEPRFFGKPARETLDYIVRHTGCRQEDIAFVGDRMYTDIAVANGSAASSILVLSGETKREELADYPYAPDVVAESLETLTELL